MRKKLIFPILPLLFLFFLAFFLRIHKVDTNPPLLVDEASIGYNAYSLLNTGKDEYGTSLPLSFKAFGDHKLPLYIYSSIPSIKIFGLTPLGIRFVSIVAGSILVFVAYYILKELKFSSSQSIIGATITAVAPWTIMLGKFAWESNLALLLFCIGLLFALKGVRTKKLNYHIIAAIFLGLTWYTYLPYRIITLPIILYLALPLFKKGTEKKTYIKMLLMFVVILIPLFPLLISPASSARFKQTNIFADPTKTSIINENRTFCTEDQPNVLCYVVSNKLVESGYTLLSNFERIFSLDFLFISGEEAKYVSVEKFGLMPIFLMPFYLLGFIYFYIERKKNENKNVYMLLLVSAFFATLPIIITKEPQRIQMSALYPFILLLIMFGYSMTQRVLKYKLLNYSLFVLLLLFGFIYLFYFTNIHSKKYYMNENFIADISVYLHTQAKQDTTIYINPFYAEPLIFYAYYNSIDPVKYQTEYTLGEPDTLGFTHLVELGNIKITSIEYNEMYCVAKKSNNRILYLTNENLSQKFNNSDIKPMYVSTSSNGVYNLGYVYNLSDLMNSNLPDNLKTCKP